MKSEITNNIEPGGVSTPIPTHRSPQLYWNQATGIVLLFTGEREGVVVVPGNTGWTAGNASTDWTPYHNTLQWARFPEERAVVLRNTP